MGPLIATRASGAVVADDRPVHEQWFPAMGLRA